MYLVELTAKLPYLFERKKEVKSFTFQFVASSNDISPQIPNFFQARSKSHGKALAIPYKSYPLLGIDRTRI